VKRLFLCALSACTIAGCGSDSEKLIAIGGVVELNGKPVGNAAVMLHHDAGRTAYAITAEDGSFKMTTREPGDGALAGRHTVTVSLSRQEGGVQPNANNLEDYSRPISAEKLTHIVPTVYNDPKTSPLTFIIEKPTNALKIELKGK
jgi:hypothetical protein